MEGEGGRGWQVCLQNTCYNQKATLSTLPLLPYLPTKTVRARPEGSACGRDLALLPTHQSRRNAGSRAIPRGRLGVFEEGGWVHLEQLTVGLLRRSSLVNDSHCVDDIACAACRWVGTGIAERYKTPGHAGNKPHRSSIHTRALISKSTCRKSIKVEVMC